MRKTSLLLVGLLALTVIASGCLNGDAVEEPGEEIDEPEQDPLDPEDQDPLDPDDPTSPEDGDQDPLEP